MSTRPPILLRPIEDIDPRLHAEPRDLVLASRNAYPLVAQQGKKSDSTGLVAGAGIALLLGGVTFWSMSAHRTPPAPKPEMLAPVAPPPVLAPLVPYYASAASNRAASFSGSRLRSDRCRRQGRKDSSANGRCGQIADRPSGQRG